MKKFCVYFGVFLIALCLLACGTKRNFPNVPAEVEKLANDYLQAAGIGTEKAVEYIYFPEGADELKQLFVAQTEQRLESYNILKIEPLSDELYALTIKAVPNYEPDEFLLYNFIGKIGGKWYYMPSQQLIPEQMKIGIDLAPYTYLNEDGGLLIKE